MNTRDPARWPMLITPAELRAAPGYGDPAGGGPVIIDCRFNLMQPAAGREAYLAGHVPGAHYADLDQDLAGARTAASGRHPLPAPEDLQRRLAAWGIRAQTPVVAYDDAGGAIAARLWWLLRWLGHERVALLDGGLPAWQREGLPVESEVPKSDVPEAAMEGSFEGRPGRMPVLDTPALVGAATRGEVTLVDVRAADRYLGGTEPIDPVAGHIPGALNAPFAGSLDAEGRFLSPEELRRRYRAIVGDRPAGEVVFMCGSGVTACHGIFTYELAGFPGAVLYPGSWSEWIRDPARPVARG